MYSYIGGNTSIRLDPDLEERLRNLAQSTGRSLSFYIKQALANSIDQLEYEYQILSGVEKYRRGELLTRSLEEVGHILDLED